MGSDLLLQLDGSPDFFNRSRGYEDWTIIVAEEKDQILGSAGFSTHEKTIDDSLYQGVYEYGFMVDPTQRRRGIASLLQAEIEEHAFDNGADFLYLNVTEDNEASHRMFTGMGFTRVRECSPLMFMAYKKHETDHYKIRPMKEGDIPVVVTLLNEYNKSRDFYTPLTDASFKDYYNRLPFYSMDNIFIYEHDTVKAVAGFWDYAKIMRFTLQSYNTRWKLMSAIANVLGKITAMPKVPGIGEQLTSWYLTPFAYRDPEAARQLLMHVLNLAQEKGIYMVGLPVDKESHAYSDLNKLQPNKVGFTFYMKPYVDLPKIREIYVDPLDV